MLATNQNPRNRNLLPQIFSSTDTVRDSRNPNLGTIKIFPKTKLMQWFSLNHLPSVVSKSPSHHQCLRLPYRPNPLHKTIAFTSTAYQTACDSNLTTLLTQNLWKFHHPNLNQFRLRILIKYILCLIIFQLFKPITRPKKIFPTVSPGLEKIFSITRTNHHPHQIFEHRILTVFVFLNPLSRQNRTNSTRFDPPLF